MLITLRLSEQTVVEVRVVKKPIKSITVLLPTANVKLMYKTGRVIQMRAPLDPGSSTGFIVES